MKTYAEYIKASDYYSEIVLRGVEIFQNGKAWQMQWLIQSGKR